MTETTLSIVRTPRAILLFPNLWEAKPVLGPNGKPTGEAKFGTVLLIDPAATLPVGQEVLSVQRLKDVAGAVAKAKWPGRAFKELAWPFKDGNSEADRLLAKWKNAGKAPKEVDFYRGKFLVKTSSKFQPAILDVNNKQIDTAREGNRRGEFYSGVEVVAELNFVAYNGVGQNPDGVTAYINAVRKLADGKRIAGRDAAQAFAGIAGGQTTYDPTGGAGGAGELDDEIPF